MSLRIWKDQEKEEIAARGNEDGMLCSYYQFPHVPGKIFVECRVFCEGINFYLFELYQEGGALVFKATVSDWDCRVLGSRSDKAGLEKEGATRYAVGMIISETVPLPARDGIEDFERKLRNAIALSE
jgi:hypothetical protein